MTMSALPSWAGFKLYIAAASPATEDKAGYDALTWVEVADMINHPAIVVESESNKQMMANGFEKPSNRGKKCPDVSVVLPRNIADAAQVIIKAGALESTNTVHSFKVVDADTKYTCYQAILSDYGQTERGGNEQASISFKAQPFAQSVVYDIAPT